MFDADQRRFYASNVRLTDASDSCLNTPPFSTRQRIIRAAEDLFARRGFAGTSMRQVTAEAKANLAAVNYHFGSKDSLIEEVLRLRLDELNQQRIAALEQVLADDSPTLEALLEAFIGPALALSQARGGGAFVRVLARAYAEQDERLREFISDNYGYVLKRFATEFAILLPTLERQELYWRLDMVAGALTYAMADFGITKRRDGASEQEHRQLAAKHLIHFAAAGLRAET